jgi:hypothetical protein
MYVFRFMLKTAFVYFRANFFRDHHHVSLVILRLFVDGELYMKELLLI